MALSANRNTPSLGAGGTPVRTNFPVEASTHVYKGSLVGINSSGNLVPMGGTSLTCVGTADQEVNNTGSAGALSCEVIQGVSRWVNGNSMTKASVGSVVYASDDQTVTTSGSGNSIAGTLYLVDSSGCWVYSGLAAPIDASSLTTFESNLAATSTGQGASLVGVEDASSLLTATDVEAALTEIVKKANAGLGTPTSIYCLLANATSAAVVGRFTPGVAGKISKLTACVVSAATTSGKLATITPAIGGVSTTGGALDLSSTNCATVGAKINASAISGNNSYTSTDEITLVASSVTTFIEGSVMLLLFPASA